MEIDQLIFKRIHKFYKKLTVKVDLEQEKRTVNLEPLKPRLTILSRALTGLQNEVVTSEREGGWSGLKFYLPQNIAFCEKIEDNINFFIFRVLYLSVQQKERINWPEGEDQKVSLAQSKAEESSAQILAQLFDEYPATKTIYETLKNELEQFYKKQNKPVDYSWLFGRWMKQNPHEFIANTTSPNQNKNLEKPEITTEMDANPSDEVTVVGIDKKQIEDNVVQNQFEKVDTLSEFNGTFKEMEGEDTLSDDEEALRELSLKHTVRADDISHSVYKAEFVNTKSNILVEAENEKGNYLFYDEWDYKKRVYKPNFCKVYPKTATIKSESYAKKTLQENASTLKELFRLFAQIHNEYEKVERVNAGDEIDFDAVTDAFTEMLSQRTPSEKLYTTKRKRKKDLSVLILLDTSLSADGYTNNERVLDVEKKAVILFGEVLNDYNISFQVDTFSSRTRNNCSYQSVKTFRENWAKAKLRIGGIETEGYTRIGTALRHAGSLLEKEPTQRKWIILLSDGKPNDYDTYEGVYGVEDVKQSLRELDKKHINTFALAIEAQAKYYLPQMFGHNNYNILPKPSDLPIAFSKFYKRIIND
ncbi:MAG: VWA domain-containing protein [Flavobacteriales bacterium]|nr:VWA domain-containing protein [Flavobacteriales bacterium]MCB9364015.1 VWA domain-containing protein [Flavobacteriales bacterium]